MVTAAITSKWQVTIPASVRASLGIEAGSRLEFVEIAKGQYSIVPVNIRVQELKGMLTKPKIPVTIEKMNEIIAKLGAAAQ